MTLLSLQAMALDSRSTLALYHKIFSAITHKQSYSVYCKSKKYADVFRRSKHIRLVHSPTHADIFLVTSQSDLPKEKGGGVPLYFATQYRMLVNSPSVVGALYWRKGRVQILFIRSRLRKYGISLPAAFSPYMVDTP